MKIIDRNYKGTERHETTPDNYVMVSAAKDKIMLPYHGEEWGDLVYYICQAALELSPGKAKDGGLYDNIIKSTDIAFSFNIQERVRVLAYVDIESYEGRRKTARFLMDASRQEIMQILTAFFSQGGKGLSPEIRDYYRRKFETWGAGAN